MQNSGIGFVGILQIVFITLKLAGVIHWSWWWVMAPFWMSAAIVVLFIVLCLAFGAMLVIAGYSVNRKKK